MSLTFENLIAHNRHTSWGLVIAVTALLILLGAAIGSFVAVHHSGPDTNPIMLGMSIGAILAIIGACVSYYAGRAMITTATGARRIEKFEDPLLFNVTEEMAIAAGLPPPQIYVIGDDAPNAFATGRDPKHAIIGITTGLRAKLNRDELQAVIAHEMAHIKNFDIRLMMLIAVYAGIIVLIADILKRMSFDSMRFSGGSTRTRSRTKGSPLTILVILAALLLGIIAPIFARLLQLAISREREYLADATAVQLCRNPGALASALRKIAMDDDPSEFASDATAHLFIINPDPKRRLKNSDWNSVWSTHPPLIKRIARLNQLAA
jgi:heat shock protein HtpX